MSVKNNQPTNDENERWTIKLHKEKALKRKKQNNRIGVLKIVAWMLLFGLPLLFQYAYFTSLKNISFSVDLGLSPSARMTSVRVDAQTQTYSNEFDINQLADEVKEYADSIIEPIFYLNSKLNMSIALTKVLINETLNDMLITPLSNFLGQPIINISDLENALRNFTIPRDIIDPIYERLFRWEIPKLFPASWDNLVYFYISYDGIFPITNLKVTVDLVYGTPIRLIQSVDSILSTGEKLTLSLKISTVLQDILQSTYQVLVDTTYNSIIKGDLFFYEHFGEIFKNEFLNIDLWLSLGVNANLGLLPIKFKVDVDLIWVIQQLIEVYL